MKKYIVFLFFSFILGSLELNAQKKRSTYSDEHGSVLNVGLGVGHYGYIGLASSLVMINYEIDVAKNFTLAPFIGFYSYSSDYYWGSSSRPYRYYSYRETVIPIGIKGSYYFDELLDVNSKWDFYVSASLGASFRSLRWETDYDGDVSAVRQARPLYSTLHLGTRYHLNSKTGLFLDLSNGASTIGLSFKL